MGNSLHCILKNKIVWYGFLFGFYITLNDKIKILPLEGSNCFVALVQLPLRFFFSLSELVTLQMRNANTVETIWSCCLKNTTKQCFTRNCLLFLFTSLFWRRTVLFDSTSVSRCSLGKECASKGSFKQKRTLLIP